MVGIFSGGSTGNVRVVKYRITVGGVTHQVEATAAPVDDLNWHHVAVTHDKPNSVLELYIDGVHIAAHDQNTNGGDVATDPLVRASIGNQPPRTNQPYDSGIPGGDQRYFLGCIDQTLLFSRLIEESDVNTLWNSGAGCPFLPRSPDPQTITNNANDGKINTSAWKELTDVVVTQSTPGDPNDTQVRYLFYTDATPADQGLKYDGGWVQVPLADIVTDGMTQTEIDALSLSNWQAFPLAACIFVAVSLKTDDPKLTPRVCQVKFSYKLCGKFLVKDSEVTISLEDADTTRVLNISGGDLLDLRANLTLPLCVPH